MKNNGVISHSLLVLCIAPFLWAIFVFQAAPVSGAELQLALADSTCKTMHKVGDVFTLRTGITLAYTCKSSGLLVQGMRGGVIKADFFLSADRKWMDDMVEAGLVDIKNVDSLWANELVVVTRAGNSDLKLTSLKELAAAKVTTIIIGDPSNAPFGRYAKQALEHLGLWPDVREKIISRKNISLVIESIKTDEDENAVGIIFRTGLDKELLLLAAIPREMSELISYYSAPLKISTAQEETSQLLTFLKGAEAGNIFAAAGFVVLP